MNKYRFGLNTTGPTQMISQLGWPLLITRRKISRLSLMYKMTNDLTLMSYRSLLKPFPYHLKSLHPHAFIPLDRLPPKLYYSTSFFPQTVMEWNSLPASVFPEVPSLEAFKSSVWALYP